MVEAHLYVPPVPGDGALILRIPEDALLSGAQRDQVNHAVAEIHCALLSRYGVMVYGATRQPPEGQYEIITMQVEVWDGFTSPAKMNWKPDSSCPECGGVARVGFGRRLPCPSCHAGATAYRLNVGACSILVHADAEGASPVWLVRVVAPEPYPLSEGRWLGWWRHVDLDCYLLESAESWVSCTEALDFGEQVAREVESLRAASA